VVFSETVTALPPVRSARVLAVASLGRDLPLEHVAAAAGLPEPHGDDRSGLVLVSAHLTRSVFAIMALRSSSNRVRSLVWTVRPMTVTVRAVGVDRRGERLDADLRPLELDLAGNQHAEVSGGLRPRP